MQIWTVWTIYCFQRCRAFGLPRDSVLLCKGSRHFGRREMHMSLADLGIGREPQPRACSWKPERSQTWVKKDGWQKTIESDRRHPKHSLHIYTPYIKIRILHSLYIFQCERISMLFGPWIYTFIAFLAKVMAQNLPVFVMHYVAGWKTRSMFEAVALNRWEEAIQKHTMILDRILYVLLII